MNSDLTNFAAKHARRAHRVACMLGAALALVIAGCAGPAYPPAPRDASSADYEYLIGPLDTVNIIVWRNPELSMTVPVRPDGKMTTPLVDDLPALGKTPTALARDIEKALGKYIRDPVVTVIVTTFVGPSSEQIRVIGEAAKPQMLAFRQHMTLLDVMIAVGGLTDFADGNAATIFRVAEGASLQRARAGPGQARRHLRQRRHAPGRHPDHSAELVLTRRAGPRSHRQTGTYHERADSTGSRQPPRHVASPLDRAGRGLGRGDRRRGRRLPDPREVRGERARLRRHAVAPAPADGRASRSSPISTSRSR